MNINNGQHKNFAFSNKASISSKSPIRRYSIAQSKNNLKMKDSMFMLFACGALEIWELNQCSLVCLFCHLYVSFLELYIISIQDVMQMKINVHYNNLNVL